MSHYKPYAAYRDSGVEWLGQVPEHWDIAQFKRIVSINNGSDHKAIESDDGFPVYGSGGTFAYASSYIYDGESVLLGRKGTINKPLYVHGKFWTVDTMYWTKIMPNANGKFCYYVATTIPFDYYATNTALPSMTQTDLGSHVVTFPDRDEQAAIAAALDRETTRIDALIQKKNRFIELLKEKRQALITHAVTKGLNPDVKMKDSGVEWIGQVPEHWEATKLKYIAAFSGGGTPTKDNPDYWNGSIPWVSPKDMKHEAITHSIDHITPAGLENSATKLIDSGAVLLVARSGILRHTIPVGINQVPVSLNQDMKALTLDVTRVRPRYMLLWVQGLNRSLLDVWAKQGATVESLEHEYVANSPLPLPNLEEQDVIIATLDREAARIDTLIAKTQQSITLLKERRAAFITAAVTGQIDLQGE